MDKARQQVTGSHWEQHISTWSESGLTLAAYCRLHGLNAKYFSNRLTVHRKATSGMSATPLTMVPIVIKSNDKTRPITTTITLQHRSGWQLNFPSDVQTDWLGNLLSKIA
jgi:hypothetical protein